MYDNSVVVYTVLKHNLFCIPQNIFTINVIFTNL